MDINNPLIDALKPLTSRVRRDVTAIRRDGKQAWTRDPLTRERLAHHLNGGPARGVCPIKAGESVTMVGLIDFDSHKGEVSWSGMSGAVSNVADQLQLAYGASPIIFRSTGGNGVHLYVLFNEAQDAYSVRQWLGEVLQGCGLRDGAGGLGKGQAEVFPRQDSVPEGGYGNQFTLPLAQKSELLELDDLSGMLVVDSAGRTAAGLMAAWKSSPPVPVRSRPSRPVVTRSGAEVGEGSLRDVASALAAIPNDDVDYDAWRNLAYATHAATAGSAEGLALMEEWSSRSPKYVAGYLEEKVWSYATGDRAGGIGPGTLFHRAAQHGWVNPGAAAAVPDPDDFEAIAPRRTAAVGHVVLLDDADADLAGVERGLVVLSNGALAPAGSGGGSRSSGGAMLRPEDHEPPAYDREKSGAVKPTVGNAVLAVRDQWEVGVQVAHDVFRDEMLIAPAGAKGQWRPLADGDIVRLRMAMEARRFKQAPKELARDAVVLVSEENAFDSAQMWLAGVAPCWDGTRRVDTFLRDFFGCEDTAYTRAVSRYIWTALAGRVLSPGCYAAMAPILVGPQGIGKSRGLKAMSPDPMFFVEIDFNKDETELARLLRGVLVCEIAELRGLHTRDKETIKAWMSRTHEKWIPKFKEFATTFARRSLCLGTSNTDEVLADESGERRWLPAHVRKVDVEGIEAARDQLWAEGAALFDGLVPGWAGGIAWEEAERLAKSEHSTFKRSDPWDEPFRAWLDECDPFDGSGGVADGGSGPVDGAAGGAGGSSGAADAPRGGGRFALSELLAGAIGMQAKDVTLQVQQRAGSVLRGLGYAKRDCKVDGRVLKRWTRVPE